jgi:hypothetical protein
MRSSVIVFVFVAVVAGGCPCLALSIPLAPQGISYDGIYGQRTTQVARPNGDVRPPPVVIVTASCRC